MFCDGDKKPTIFSLIIFLITRKKPEKKIKEEVLGCSCGRQRGGEDTED